MEQYTSYYLYQKYETRGEQEAIPVYPNVYSIDGDGTRERIVKLENDPQCGYEPQAIYRWTNIPITQDYVCDDCPEYQTRWVKTNDTTCIESPDPPTPTMKKVVTNYSDGKVTEVECNGNTMLKKDEVRPYLGSPISSIIGDCVTSIADAAYQRFYSLTSITIGNNVTTIGSAVFLECNTLSSVTIPNSVQTIGSSAFETCRDLANVTLGNSVRDIGERAFYYCPSLTSITIPDSVASIGRNAFRGCSGMTSVTMDNCAATIGGNAFAECGNILNVTMGNSVRSIGDNAFYGCGSLTSCTIGSGVTSIGGSAFYNCGSLSRVNSNIDGVCNIPSGVTTIGGNAFYGCGSITSCTIPDSVTSFSSLGFSNLKTCTIGSGVTSIGDGAFAGCGSLSRVNSNIDGVCNIPSGVTSIGGSAFNNCRSLTSINIPSGVTVINDYTFERCTSLTSVTIPSGVTSLGKWAFYVCSGLISITVEAVTPPSLGKEALDFTNNCPIYVPCESVLAYKSAWSSYADRIFGIPPCEPSPYDEYFSIKNERLSEPQTLTLRLSGAPRNYYYSSDGEVWEYLYSGSGNVVIPSGAKYYFKGEGATLIGADNIGTFVMSSTNPNDTSVTIQGNIMSLLYKDNFKGQTSLEGKDHIFESLFSGCTYITLAENLVLPATTLSDRCYQNMFNGCTNLRTAPELPATKIGYGSYSSMFSGCASLTKAPSILPAIPKNGSYASMFSGCASLTKAPELPSVIVGESSYVQMFWGCTSLNYIKCLATSLNSGSTSFWTRGVSPTGTFVKAASMSNWTTGESGIPSGWTVQDA